MPRKSCKCSDAQERGDPSKKLRAHDGYIATSLEGRSSSEREGQISEFPTDHSINSSGVNKVLTTADTDVSRKLIAATALERKAKDAIKTKRHLASYEANENAKLFGQMIFSPFEPIAGSEGMSVLRGVPSLESGQKEDCIVVRPGIETFWEACISKANPIRGKCTVIVVGTPGIGKTTTTPLLIRQLLMRGETVVYLIRTKERVGFYYSFVPIKGSNNEVTGIKARAYSETMETANVPGLESSSSYFIVDPGKTKDSCDPEDTFKPKVIIVSSPESKHWGGSSAGKGRDPAPATATKMHYPLWTKEELISAMNVLEPKMKKSTFEERFRIFGGVP
jgi:hypothetical protein